MPARERGERDDDRGERDSTRDRDRERRRRSRSRDRAPTGGSERRSRRSRSRSRSRSPSHKRRRSSPGPTSTAGPSGKHEEPPMSQMTEEERQMKELLGFGAFHSTKGEKEFAVWGSSCVQGKKREDLPDYQLYQDWMEKKRKAFQAEVFIGIMPPCSGWAEYFEYFFGRNLLVAATQVHLCALG